MGWNGADLVDDFAAELGDTSSAFETKVLRWVNEGLRDIATSHTWPFLRTRGQAVLTSGQDTHQLGLGTPSAPTVSATSGGSLAADTAYYVLVTFYESVSGVESIAGTSSAVVTPTGANLTISVSSIPVSTSPLVTSRRVYLKKGSAAFYLSTIIANNTATTTTITADTSSVTTPPDYDAIYKLDGDLYLENTRVLEGYTIQRLRFEADGTVNTSGTPSIWAPVDQDTVAVYPKPSSNTTVTFYYYRMPMPVFNSTDSQPQLPVYLYEALHDYVIWRGFQYRDRAGQESKRSNYDAALRIQISRKGNEAKKSGRIRSVTPDSDGYAT